MIDKANTLVLAIDDNANLLLSTKAIIDANGYNCIIAEGGRAGINILQSLSIDIVLLDLSMPEIDGYEVLKTIRQQDIDTEIIIVSGEATFENATQVFKYGVFEFINKPYKPQKLISTLDNVAYKISLKKNLFNTQKELEESEKCYRFIANNSPDIIYITNEKGFFTFINTRVTDLLGYKPETLIGKHFSVFIHEDDLNIAKYVFNERRTGKRSNQNVELRLKCADQKGDSKSLESNTIVIELNSMGMYGNKGDRSVFVGSYGVVRDISERKKAQEKIHFQAYHDLLTNLPNRALFLDRLKHSLSLAIRKKCKLAVLFLDVDGFKFINDSLGHVIGDNLLQHVAHRLQDALRDADIVSRIGGDEFNILLPELKNREEAELVAQKIIKTFNQPIILDEHEITISFSIGISIYPDDALNSDELIKNADIAMYHIKKQGKNGYEFFSDNMQSIYLHHHTIEQDIRKALEENQFESYYQPQYNIITQKITGLEALIRWNQPDKGFILPDKFILIAEESGLINEIGLYMLETGCRQLKAWIDKGITPVKLAINVSTYQLSEKNFDTILCDIVKRYELPKNSITIEITESALIQRMDLILSRLNNLVKCGIGISIDDFGVGYSCLSYLHTLPIDTLKIDKSFLSNTRKQREQASIIKAIVAMARELSLDVIVEGIETNEQLEYIKKIGCTTAQGFLLGRPLSEPETSKLLIQNQSIAGNQRNKAIVYGGG